MPKCASPPKPYFSESTVTPTKRTIRARSIRIACATAGMIIRPWKAWRCSRVIPICKYWTRQARACILSRYQIGRYVRFSQPALRHGARRKLSNFRAGSGRPPKRIKAGLTRWALPTSKRCAANVGKHFPMIVSSSIHKGRSAQAIYARLAAAVKMSTDPNGADGPRGTSID